MTRGFSFATCIALALCLAANASAQKIVLKHQFPDSKSTTTVTTTETTQTLTLAGMEINTGSNQTLTVISTNGVRGADGKLEVKSKIDEMKSSVSLPGGVELEFDSNDADADPPGTQFDFLLDIFKATANSTWTMVLDGENQVVAIEGREKAFDGLPENLKEAIKGQTDPLHLKQVANDEFGKLPDTPVAPNDTWTRTNTVRLDSGQKLTFTNDYTYTGTTNGRAKITSKTTKVEYSADADSPLKVTSSDLKVTESDGTTIFDVEKGYVVSTEQSMRIKGELKLEISGNELAGTLDLKMKSSSKIKE